MTTVARRNPEDSAKIKAIEEKLLANPEMAKLIDELGTSTTDANDLVRGLAPGLDQPGPQRRDGCPPRLPARRPEQQGSRWSEQFP